MENYKITALKPKHLGGIYEIEKQSFAKPWSRESIAGELENPFAFYLICEGPDGLVLGYVGVHIILGEGHITNIAVREGFRRRGIAKSLVSQLVSEAKEMDLELLTLEVRQSNAAAHALYEKFGFKVSGQRKAYYEDPREDGDIMTLFFEGN